jgi:hypothetical protein
MQNGKRIQELMTQNTLLRVDSLGLYFVVVYPRLLALFGVHPKLWDAGKVATQDTVRDGIRLQIHKGLPLYAKAAEESVSARKECIRIGFELIAGCVEFHSFCSTDETADMHQQLLEVKWGKDGSILASACMDYRFSRHFMISQGIGGRIDPYLYHTHAQAAAEYCGNVQQMVQLFEKQLGDVREFVKRGVPGLELLWYVMCVCLTVRAEEFNALYPISKEMVVLFESCEGQCTDPSDCEGWYESADWSTCRTKYPNGYSSKDGLLMHADSSCFFSFHT